MITKPVATVIYGGVISVSARRSISTVCPVVFRVLRNNAHRGKPWIFHGEFSTVGTENSWQVLYMMFK